MQRYKFFGAYGLAGYSCMMVILLVTGCKQNTLPDTRASDEQAIRALDNQWSKTAASHDLEGTLAFYADDAILLPPDEPLAADKTAIKASWTGALAAMATVSWEIKTIEVAKSGDLAFITGAWMSTAKGPNGTTIPSKGKLVEVWKKQPSGQWKCITDIYNSDAPATMAATSPK